MSEMNLNEHLRLKYRSDRPTQGYPAKPRTGNSAGPTKDKRPVRQPCKRATAGAKNFGSERREPRRRVLVVDGLTGKAHMEDL